VWKETAIYTVSKITNYGNGWSYFRRNFLVLLFTQSTTEESPNMGQWPRGVVAGGVRSGHRQKLPSWSPHRLTEIAGLDIDGLDNDGLDNDWRIWAIDCNLLKIAIQRFYQLTGTYNSFESVKASYVLRHMKFALICKNYERAMSITWRVVYWH